MSIIIRNFTSDLEGGDYQLQARLDLGELRDSCLARIIYEGIVSASAYLAHSLEHLLERVNAPKSETPTIIDLTASGSGFTVDGPLNVYAELDEALIKKIQQAYTKVLPIVTAQKVAASLEEILPSPLRGFETLMGSIFGGNLATNQGFPFGGDIIDVTILGPFPVSFGHPSEDDDPFGSPFFGATRPRPSRF